MYNFNHLYYFYITAKSGSVTNAAKYLHISQPSLSSQLKVLEQALKMRLFEKVGRRNELTEIGTHVYGLCRQMFELSEELGELSYRGVPSESRRICIGVSDEIDRPFVVEMVSHFLKEYELAQRPKVMVISGTHHQLIERLQFRELDAVVTPNAIIDTELEGLDYAEVPVALICSRKLKIRPKNRTLQARDIVEEIIGGGWAHWVMPSSRFKLRLEIDKFFEENELTGRVVFESDMISSIVRSVIDEVGMAFIPLLYVAREVRENLVHALGPKDGYWKYRVWLSCHKQNKVDELVLALSRSFKAICHQAG